MGWDGDISKMGQLARNIGKLAAVPSKAAPLAAKRIGELIQQEFEGEADPYGTAWKPLAPATIERHGDHKILHLSGVMQSEAKVFPLQGSGVGITIPHPAEDHQTGWVREKKGKVPAGHGPPRPVLPAHRMPPLWDEAIKSAVSETVRGTMRGAA